ncbi:MAG: RNA polymerase sigma factor [bacterium]
MEQERYAKFLAQFDPAPERARQKHDLLYADLIGFFTKQLEQASLKRDQSSAKELANETMLRIAERAIQGEQIRSLSDYAFRFSWNVWHEYLRQLKKDKRKIEIDDANIEISDDTDQDPDSEASKKKRLKCMRQCLDNLHPNQRELMLAHLDAKAQGTSPELAKQLNMTIGALRLRIFHLRVDLKACRNACLKRLKKD